MQCPYTTLLDKAHDIQIHKSIIGNLFEKREMITDTVHIL